MKNEVIPKTSPQNSQVRNVGVLGPKQHVIAKQLYPSEGQRAGGQAFMQPCPITISTTKALSPNPSKR